jgi:radical SAM superfamily enzyme YgiQ (UPF0313 family)
VHPTITDKTAAGPKDNWQWLELVPERDVWGVSDQRCRVLLVAINMPGYYSLPVRILSLMANQSKRRAQKFDVRYVEFENSDNLDNMVDVISAWHPDLVGFSMNIWNRDATLHVLEQLKKTDPNMKMMVGGQEVSHSVVDYLEKTPAMDYLIDGEGELPFLQFLDAWDPTQKCLKDPVGVTGLRYRSNGLVVSNGPSDIVPSLDDIPSPILAGLVDPQKKYQLGVMLEGARGCPFKCSFCFEGGRKIKVRTTSIERLDQEATVMANMGATYFHIMDPILCNSDPERLGGLTSIFERLTAQNPRIVTSVEAYAHQVTPDVANFLKRFTIVDVGLQTAHPETARAIHRPWRPEKFKTGLAHLRNAQVPYNLYLICGLPFETLLSYIRGIREVLKERPTRIFLNELCILNGTELRKRSHEYGYVFDASPPYTLRVSKWMTGRELKIAEVISKIVEKQYNLSAKAVHTTAPWLPKTPPSYGKKASIHLPGPCTNQCKDCGALKAVDSSMPDDLEALLSHAMDMDVDIKTGDRVDVKMLLRLVGQLNLAGAARIRLVAPLSFFQDYQLLETLVHRGVWHFMTHIDVMADRGDDLPDKNQMQALDHFSNTFSLTGYADIKPALEVVTLFKTVDGFQNIRNRERLTSLKKRHMSVLTIPEAAGSHYPAMVKPVTKLFWDGIDSLNWVKLPEAYYQSIFNTAPEKKEILSHIEALGLISHAVNRPPCFWPSQEMKG